MTAIGRLWRRAPAWRLCLAAAVATTGLAAMFPPALPSLSWPRAGRVADGAARYHPQDSAVPTDRGLLHLPPPDAGRQGMIPYAGRSLPLPPGTWHELAVAQAGTARDQVTVLDRISNQHLMGLVVATAPGALSGTAGPVGLPLPCTDPQQIDGHMVPAQPTDGPLTHQCWSIAAADMRQVAGGDASRPLQAGLQRLGHMNVAVPNRMLAATFFNSDDTGWQLVTVFMPDARGLTGRLHAWAGRYAVPLHRGFDHRLTDADLPGLVPPDPG